MRLPLTVFALLLACVALACRQDEKGDSRLPSKVANPQLSEEERKAQVAADLKLKQADARARIAVLTAALHRYYLDTDDFPENLSALTRSDPNGRYKATVTDKQLLDPWNRPFHYDPTKRNDDDMPRIWSDGPPPHRPEDRIDNWEEKKDDAGK
jgi:hypothetical protein